MLIVTAGQVRQILDGAEGDVLEAVRAAYLLHAEGKSTLPHSVFLRFPDDTRNRIIALPAYLGSTRPLAGVKWISSFPGNVAGGRARASAAIILNSVSTGYPEALLEASTISARRTAASAALAASILRARTPESGVSLIGCGVINFEVLAFLRSALPEIAAVTVFDLDESRAAAFAERCCGRWPELKVQVAGQVEDALGAHRVVCLATTASAPYLSGDRCQPGTLILHLSLRDLTVDTILSAVNVVDDADHACRAETSLQLAERQVGHRGFIEASLGEILLADSGYRRSEDSVTVFSPFGLGILDLAVAELVRLGARRQGLGMEVPEFLSAE